MTLKDLQFKWLQDLRNLKEAAKEHRHQASVLDAKAEQLLVLSDQLGQVIAQIEREGKNNVG